MKSKLDLAIANRLTYNEVKEILNICRSKHGRDCMACPLYKKQDCIEIITANALSIIECQAAENKRLEINLFYEGEHKEEDIYYIVKIKEDITNGLFNQTTIRHKFCGRLVNQNNGNFYFELNGAGGLVIIPHDWIEWMAPSKVHWNLRRKNYEKNDV